MRGTWLTLAALAFVAAAACKQRYSPPRAAKAPVDRDMDNSPVPVANSSAPTLDESWDAKNFLTRADAEAMGADMRSPDPCAYSCEGSAHKFALGLDEIQVMIWAYTDTSGASDRYEKEKKDDSSWCVTALKMNKAAVAEIGDPGITGNAYLKKVVRTDGWRIATFVVQKGKFVVKVSRQENKDDIAEAIDRGRKAVAYVLNKLN
jgi:hypothetical protein